ncbi:MAG TPA: hypothetical protein VK842_01750, partial [bacterium]|nr:hypothetical protein [bacterium]
MRPARFVSPLAASTAVALALLAWVLARLALHAAWDLPLLSPGTGVLLLLALAGLWATVEEPRLNPGGGKLAARWLGAAALLAAGQAVIYYRIEAKDRVAGLGFAALAGGALMAWPRMRPGARAAGW